MKPLPVSLVVLVLSSALGASFSPFPQQQEEVQAYYKKWLDQDVVYVITEEEREIFQNLQTDAERDHFIEQFWRRRDPDPRTAVNEFKEEYYRRIHYVNERFTAGIPGWRTHRGMAYIKFGPADDVQDYPAGSTYVRPRHEGGGTTLVSPFQVWRYNYIEGIGSDIEIEFVDTHGGNLYRFARDELEKDMLLYHPLGFTISEQLLGGDKTERIVTRHFGDLEEKLRNQIGRTPRAKDEPFERLRTVADIEAAPQIQYTDLRRIVTTRLHYSNLPFRAKFSVLSLDPEHVLVPLAIFVNDSELTFRQTASGANRATLELYGMVTSLTNQILHEFEDTLVREQAGATWGTAVAQKKLILPPGRHKLSLVVRDPHSGKIGTEDFSLPLFSAGNDFSCSSLILAESISKASPEQTAGDPLVLSAGYKVVPQVDGVFRRGQDVQLYLELYNFAIDRSTSLPSLKIDMQILKDAEKWQGGEKALEHSLNHNELLSDRLLLMKKIPTAELEPGRYRIVMTFEDQIGNQQTAAAADFTLAP